MDSESTTRRPCKTATHFLVSPYIDADVPETSDDTAVSFHTPCSPTHSANGVHSPQLRHTSGGSYLTGDAPDDEQRQYHVAAHSNYDLEPEKPDAQDDTDDILQPNPKRRRMDGQTSEASASTTTTVASTVNVHNSKYLSVNALDEPAVASNNTASTIADTSLRSRTNDAQARMMVEHLLNELSPVDVLQAVMRGGSDNAKFGKCLSQFVSERKETSNENAYFWNNKFQEIMDLPADDVSRWRRLGNLAHDFTHAASVYGRILISERFLPVSAKTIKPITSLGGSAGGLKYICGGIMFKFCVDTPLVGDSWMYGGATASDERAMKTGGHELKAIINLLSLSPKDTQRVHFPMMAVVDYRGFRLLAEALLPIDRSTCIYGSPDGGVSVSASNARFNASMRTLAESLNLAEHTVLGERICGPGDIEGHNGRDGRFYAIDLARVFPPQWPVHGATDKRWVFYQLFRPEFVRNWARHALCSDAFTRWLDTDDEKEQHNQRAMKAAQALFEKTIPSFAADIHEMLPPLLSTEQSERAHVLALNEQLDQMINKLHNRGINIRHLGHVFKLVPEALWSAKSKLLSEMTARVLKNIIRQRLREKMRGLAFPGEEPYRQELIAYLNMILGNCKESDDYWTKTFDGSERQADSVMLGSGLPTHMRKVLVDAVADAGEKPLLHRYGPSIKYALLAKFGANCLDDTRRSDLVDLRHELGLSATVTRLVGMLGVVLTDQCINELHSHPNSLRLVGADVLEIGVRVKHMGIVNQADATALLLEARQHSNKKRRLQDDAESNEVERLLVLSRRLFEKALASMPDSFDILSGLGDVFFELAMRRAPVPVAGPSHVDRLQLLQWSLSRYAESLRAKDFSNVGRRVLARLVPVLCELASDPRIFPSKASELCAQAAVYADDALTQENNAGCLDSFICSCIASSGSSRNSSSTGDGLVRSNSSSSLHHSASSGTFALSASGNNLELTSSTVLAGDAADMEVDTPTGSTPNNNSSSNNNNSESPQLPRSLGSSGMLKRPQLDLLASGRAHVLVTMRPPRLFVALLSVAASSDVLRERVARMARRLRRSLLVHAVPEALRKTSDGRLVVADWVVERIDLSDFRPHVTFETLQEVERIFPQVREVHLLCDAKSRSSRKSPFSVALVPVANSV